MNTPLLEPVMAAPRRAHPPQAACAFAPASVGNVGVGFDLLGHSVAGAGDRAEVRRIGEPVVRIASISGCVTELPTDPRANTAGTALLSLRKALGLRHGFELVLHKGIALGSGMGGSAASCVAALIAANALLPKPLPREALYGFALDGEAVASGSRHGDNLGSMLLGGLVLATHDRLLRIDVPAAWHCALVHPHVVLETRRARAALAGHYALGEFVAQSSNLALVLAGCWRGDAALVREGLKDVLVEPRRASLIPHFAQVKQAALDHRALGASISGAGPSVFGWYDNRADAEAAAAAMQAAFAEGGLDSDAWVSPVNGPAAALIDSLDVESQP
ncbi:MULTISPECIES: homoserine kinase [Rhodanobacter]|uniref:homoserine kinase n=1 Tax=Rhodanobacter TaxID=75309 RepID=UPI000428A430|nr:MULTISPECIES: homoserine kinase [Rhodanobacter]TAN14317.1 MAG: homoserine kinase [Rhodanobacter sp.]UJJ55415.1 homoserine kinase [Rhodanobacter thiooxydans]